MPKMSYAQEVAALEEILAALRSRSEVVPPLALAVGEELAAQIAEIKALKERQRAYAAERMTATEELQTALARGMAAAHDIRACAVLLYGPKSRRLTQFGIKIRRRPRRKAESPTEVRVEASAVPRDEARTAHAARAGVAAIRGEGREVGAEVRDSGGEAGQIGGNAPDVGAPVSPIGANPAWIGAPASGDGENAPEIRGKARRVGANLPANRGAAARAA